MALNSTDVSMSESVAAQCEQQAGQNKPVLNCSSAAALLFYFLHNVSVKNKAAPAAAVADIFYYCNMLHCMVMTQICGSIVCLPIAVGVATGSSMKRQHIASEHFSCNGLKLPGNRRTRRAKLGLGPAAPQRLPPRVHGTQPGLCRSAAF